MRLAALALAPLLVVLAGCSSASHNATPTASVVAPEPHLTAGLSGEVTTSELVIGSDRFTLGIQDRGNVPIADARVHFKFFQLASAATPPVGVATANSGSVQATLRSEADATFVAPAREAGLPQTETVIRPDGKRTTVQSAGADVGVYAATASFDAAGAWAVEADVQGKNSSASGIVRLPFTVLPHAIAPAVGSPAPPSQNMTVKEDPDLTIVDTSAHPSADMHTETVADALAAHHPILVLFATPGYCTSRFCGPELEIARKLEPKYQGKVDFIHIEIWQDPLKTPMPAVVQWNLQSEPWFFIVGSDGRITARFEGPTSTAELEQALQQVST